MSKERVILVILSIATVITGGEGSVMAVSAAKPF